MSLRRAGFRLAAVTPLRKYLYYRYDYSFAPSQLCFLVSCLDQTAHIQGCVLEIGCAYGNTTVFLEKHLEYSEDRRHHVCIDTFAGFTPEDAAFEADHRGKASAGYEHRYADASLPAFSRALANNGITRVTTVQADIKTYDLSAVGQISFCLIDVDLYLPVKAALESVSKLVLPGGVIVVDDCRPHPLWDGALQAYEEFTSERDLEMEIVEKQFGIIRA